MNKHKSTHPSFFRMTQGQKIPAAAVARARLAKSALFLLILLTLGLVMSTFAMADSFYVDADGDGYGNASDVQSIPFTEPPPGYSANGDDCNDNDPDINPGENELCDGSVDENCNGKVDEGCLEWYQDSDSDGYGNPHIIGISKTQPTGFVDDNTDCDDTNGAVNPGADEICGGTVDENCDGQLNDGCPIWYRDADGDSYGNEADFTFSSTKPSGYVSNDFDCNDGDDTIHPGVTEVCDGVDNNCVDGIDEGCQTWYRDADADGYGNGADNTFGLKPTGYVSNHSDCDDGDATIHPGATEICDGVDNNCVDGIDEVCETTWYRDADNDGYGTYSDTLEAVTQPSGYVDRGGDCDDTNANVNPGAAEAPGDTIDNDCDGIIDEDPDSWYEDFDKDGYGNANTAPEDIIYSYTEPPGYVGDHTDCDDENFFVNPGRTEICQDGLDNNCNGQTDEGCTVWFEDSDSDGYGNPAVTANDALQPAGFVSNRMDCDDTDAGIHPGVVEACDDVDNNCNGIIDEDCDKKWFQDLDDDGFGNPAVSSATEVAGYVLIGGDCDDGDAAIHPGAPEVCDGTNDDNCDGHVDEGCQYWYKDADADGYGDPADEAYAFAKPGYVMNNADCDDTNSFINPDAVEKCDSVDNNCDYQVDEGCNDWYRDSDGDGYGDASYLKTDTSQPAGYVDNSIDCDDTDADINPGAFEVCDDNIDNDCDGKKDEGCLTWYQDNDGDGYGNPSVTEAADTRPNGYVDNDFDCDDGKPAVNPDAMEMCGDGLDNNCSGQVDEGCRMWYQDNDNDTWGSNVVSEHAVVQPAGYVGRTGDCDDADNAVNPDAAEACDGVDNNCDGVTDEGCRTWYRDNDGDTWGDPGTTQEALVAPAGYVGRDGDCDDGDGGVNPGAVEVCDGDDENCDGIADEGCATYYLDNDGDGYGDPAVPSYTDLPPGNYVENDFDCNDADAGVNPGEVEVCDGDDENCDGNVDEGCQMWYPDADGDSYGDMSDPGTSAMSDPGSSVTNNTDCNDGDPSIHPGALELCDGGGVDENCDGLADEGCTEWFLDNDGDGFGDPLVSQISNTQPSGYVANNADCDDTDFNVNPAQTEVCDDGIDNDCDGNTDENCLAWYPDTDGDGFGDPWGTVVHADIQPAGHVDNNLDCDDSSAAVNPGAAEVCEDYIDNNCNGETDEGCPLTVDWYYDGDGDGYGNPGGPYMNQATQPAGYVGNNEDCDDTDNAINPAAAEVCDGLNDENCNGQVDEGCTLPVDWYEDNDGDGYGDPAGSVVTAPLNPGGRVDNSDDCDDGNAAVHPGAAEVCDGVTDENCNGQVDEGCAFPVDWYEDNDGDGFGNPSGTVVTAPLNPGGRVDNALDCDDTDNAINPAAAEVCDGVVDDNCNGQVDEGCPSLVDWYEDNDGDGFGDPAGTVVTAAVNPGGRVDNNLDCDDTNNAVHPGAAEVCDGVIDDNCNGQVDEGCGTGVDWYEDNDGDGFGDPAGSIVTAVGAPGGRVDNNLDCDDTNNAINPAAPEVCDGVIDDNCNGQVDEGCTLPVDWYEDNDGDGFGNPSGTVVTAPLNPGGRVDNSDDCDDGNNAVHPGAAEVCDGTVDDNCNGQVDEGCPSLVDWYEDNDGDGFGNPSGTVVTAAVNPGGRVDNNEDCDDTDNAVHPGAAEVCDGTVDDNCNGQVDEGCPSLVDWYEDNDGDGFGDPAGTVVTAAVNPGGRVDNALDCDDTDNAIHPGAAEICDYNDNNCNGVFDEGCPQPTDWWEDNDGDGFGDPMSSAFNAYVNPNPALYVDNALDCDDTDAAVNPASAEVCDGSVDENCNGNIDEGCLTWFLDNDGDGYGDPLTTTVAMAPQPAGYVADSTDCDDTDNAIHPGATEVCGDLTDNDCDGRIDEGCVVSDWYVDGDSDGYGDMFAAPITSDSKPAGYVADFTDCDDSLASVNPGAVEICDGLDNNCVGGPDEGCVDWYQDNDGDGYGIAVMITAVAQPSGYVVETGDCDDGNAAIHPGALEICGDSVDNDCDGGDDEGCQTWYYDADGDGYGTPSTTLFENTQPANYVANGLDCDDTDNTIHPNGVEVCEDSKDNDCDGYTDEGCVTWYADTDTDGFGDPGVSQVQIGQPAGYVDNDLDCDDTNGAISPNAVEICQDSIDNDCDGSADEGCMTWYNDGDGDGYGDAAVSQVADVKPAGFVADNTDCDDGDAGRNPGLTEVCEDGIDNDCDGVTDEGCQEWFRDNDGDTYGDDGDSTVTVSDPGGYANRGGDCDDADDTIHPGALEVCDGDDNDCDSFVDERCTTWYEDKDGDGYGLSASTIEAQTPPPGYAAYDGDCDDNDPAVHPGATEICDGKDNNCLNGTDEGCITWYADDDDDRYGHDFPSVWSIIRPPGHVSSRGDCNDDNPAIHPYRSDLCDDIDNDCDGLYDEDVPESEKRYYYFDSDGDGFGDPNSSLWDCNSPGYNYVLNNEDCDDKVATIHPGAFDICGDTVDQDCSGADRDCGSSTARGCANMTDAPLETLVESAPPIVMFLLDNSGSMGWDVMCGGEDNGLYRGYSDAKCGNAEYWETQFCKVNNIYYDPGVVYNHWPGYTDADPDRPRQHPDGSPTTDMDARFEDLDHALDVPYAHYYTRSADDGQPYLVLIHSDSVTYYKIDPPGDQELDPQHITGPVALATVPDSVIIPQAWEDENRVCSAAEAANARQNFANWYQYYRTRMLVANGTLAKVVATVNGIKVGVTTININSAVGFFFPLLVDNNVEGAHDGPANRQAVIDYILAAGQPSGGTPLRKTFKNLGNFFDQSANNSQASPWGTVAEGGECQMAFIIMMTDGYYNGSNPGVDDADGDDNTAFDGDPYGDVYGQDDTLADIAMHFYERDMETTLEDHVPTTLIDKARHQHVVTYSISFGVIGTLDPKHYIIEADSTGCGFGATCSDTSPCFCVPHWPYIDLKDDGAPEKIDDLYHAAVNGRGKYFATTNVQQLTAALSSILSEITDRRGSGASVAVNTQALESDTLLYQGFYNSANWSGDLTAWALNPADGSVSDTMTWSAASILDARDLASNPRQIFTYNPDSGSGGYFSLGNMSDEQKDFLGDTDDVRQNTIDYLKGVRELESSYPDGSLRDRDSRLGDIVHSAPVHVLYDSGEQYLFVGGNDGMLHCFNALAGGGNEVFAHIPSLVYENLIKLSDPYYNHLYYIDNTPYVDDQKLLVCGLGAGGKGYFALDVSSPLGFSASDVLWEYPYTSGDPQNDHMGFSFSKPVIVPHQSGRLVIFGNGYDSTTGHAVLYALNVDANNAISNVTMLDTEVGAQTASECNGLSHPLPADVNYDNQLDYIYAGDLLGNLWKFDFTGDTKDTWKIQYGTSVTPEPLFTAEYNGVPQPITAKPGAMRHCLPNRSGYIVVFGTGQFFAEGDFDDTSQQTIYGIWDWYDELVDGEIVDPWNYSLGTPDRNGADADIDVDLGGASQVTFALLGQSVTWMDADGYGSTTARYLHDKYVADTDGDPLTIDPKEAWFDGERWFSEAATYAADYNKRYVGWYLDLYGTGERVIADTTIRAGLAIMVSLDPSPSPCQPGGNSVLTFLNACDGSKPNEYVLDTDDDGKVDGGHGNPNIKELTDIFYKPVILDEYLYFNEEDPEIGPSERLGVAYWRFLKMLHPDNP